MFRLASPTFVAYEDTPVDARVALDISPSSSDRLEAESQQKLSFYMSLVSGNSSLFAAPPHLDAASGNLSFRPTPNAYGRTVWDIVLVDDGGAEKRGHTRGQNVSAVRQLVVDVLSVNDPPSFSFKPSITLLANGDALSSFLEPNVVYDWRAGPPDEEATQRLSFSVRTDPILPASVWVTRPSLGLNGSLSVQIASSVTFVTTLTVVLRDDGGTLDGGVDTVAGNITLYFVAKPEPVTNLAILQRAEKRLDITWAHVDVARANNTPGRTELFVLELSKDCSAITSAAELANCTLFKRTLTVAIWECAASLCYADFSDLESTVRYVVSVAAQNSAGASAQRKLGAIVLRPPSAPASVNITQLASRNSTMSVLKLDWNR